MIVVTLSCTHDFNTTNKEVVATAVIACVSEDIITLSFGRTIFNTSSHNQAF